MIQYYFETHLAPGLFCLTAIIDEHYYWSMEWLGNPQGTAAAIKDVSAGFATETIRKKCITLRKVDSKELHAQFGSFAYYIERAVSGFKSYVLWISPDPAVSDISWQIPLN
jgi:hypothetical protein